jgi:hypothetical protein
MEAITISIDENGKVTIVDEADDEMTVLEEEHVAVLLQLVFDSDHYEGIGSFVDYRLNDKEYYHEDDDSVHENCITRDDFYAAKESLDNL